MDTVVKHRWGSGDQGKNIKKYFFDFIKLFETITRCIGEGGDRKAV